MPSDPRVVTPIKEGAVKTGFAYDNRVFFSYQEILCYQYLKSKGIPGKKMHMEYRVGRNHFDFFPLKRVFWEHHPILRITGEPLIEYGERRRAILDSEGYGHIPLVVSDCTFKSISEINQNMAKQGVDYRTGHVPNSSIIYITETENAEIITELLVEPLLF